MNDNYYPAHRLYEYFTDFHSLNPVAVRILYYLQARTDFRTAMIRTSAAEIARAIRSDRAKVNYSQRVLREKGLLLFPYSTARANTYFLAGKILAGGPHDRFFVTRTFQDMIRAAEAAKNNKEMSNPAVLKDKLFELGIYWPESEYSKLFGKLMKSFTVEEYFSADYSKPKKTRPDVQGADIIPINPNRGAEISEDQARRNLDQLHSIGKLFDEGIVYQ